MMAWLESCTVPRTLPLLDCVQAGAAVKSSPATANLKNTLYFIGKTSSVPTLYIK
jgi:hypothetical protein